MGTLTKLKAWFSAEVKASTVVANSCIVDVNRVAGAKSGRDRIPPRAQIQALQRLARFAKKESIRLVAVIDGKELRDVAHGADYQGITVYFSEKSGSLVEAICKASQKHQGALVITDNRDVEKKVSAQGAETMRVSSLKKGLDSVLGGSGGSPSRSGAGGNQRRRSSGGGKQRRPAREKSEGVTGKKEEPKDVDPVSELIDLVE